MPSICTAGMVAEAEAEAEAGAQGTGHRAQGTGHRAQGLYPEPCTRVKAGI
jgi:hypothetical protein